MHWLQWISCSFLYRDVIRRQQILRKRWKITTLHDVTNHLLENSKLTKLWITNFPLGKIWKVSDWYLAVQNTSKWGKVINFLFDGRRFGLDSWQVQEICLSSTQSRLSLRPNQPATQCRGYFSWVRRLRMKLTIHFRLETRFKTRKAIPTLHHMPSWRMCKAYFLIKYRYIIYTFILTN